MIAYDVIHELSDEQIVQLHQLYQEQFWSSTRTLEDVQTMLQHTDVVIAFCEPESRELIAFVRAITDRIFKALVLDVMVAAPYRQHKLGRALMDALFEHPILANVKHFELYCRPHMVPFYEKWGFTNELGEMQFMRRS